MVIDDYTTNPPTEHPFNSRQSLVDLLWNDRETVFEMLKPFLIAMGNIEIRVKEADVGVELALAEKIDLEAQVKDKCPW